jgi:hypothetical protein
MDEATRSHLRNFTVLVEPDDDTAVNVIPGALNDILIELRLKHFGSLRTIDPPGLTGDQLRLHVDRQKAIELAHKILAVTGETARI